MKNNPLKDHLSAGCSLEQGISAFHLRQIVRGFLINKVIQPVAEKHVAVGAPGDAGRIHGIIIRIIIFRRSNRRNFGHECIQA